MRATNVNGMLVVEFLSLWWRSVRGVRNMQLSSLLGLAVLLVVSFGCGGPSSSQADQGSSASLHDLPELTEDMIRERINDARVREVPAENGTAPSTGTSTHASRKRSRSSRSRSTARVRRSSWTSRPRRLQKPATPVSSPGRSARSGSCGPVGCCGSGRLSGPRISR
jgi:hypothetical protein